ncbi:TetR/AcrR family transcriptional regulator [Shewanella sp. CAL98-MNA-CIBAN-0140]|uniref:TetR/AcrR family transcriptional regulator n=1 Tax=Shewanella sp. CAL98-MNA-CIBAN-0140 TaxID=3140462 RepID=UPI00332729DE
MNVPQTVAQLNLDLGPKARTVIHAASKIFLTHGFNGATTDMIQREAGVSKSTVYAHFANKETLFLAVIQNECAMFTASIQDIEFTPGNINQSLRLLGHAYLNVILSDSALALYRIVVAEAPRFPSLGHMFYRSGPNVVKSMVATCLSYANNANEINLNDINEQEAAEVFIALMRSELHLYRLTHPDKPVEPSLQERWTEIAIMTFVRAYGVH